MEITTKGNGRMIKKKEMVFIFTTLLAKNTKENGRTVSAMAKEFIILHSEINMMDCKQIKQNFKNILKISSWENGFKSGRGQLFYSSGAKYEGLWQNDRANG